MENFIVILAEEFKLQREHVRTLNLLKRVKHIPFMRVTARSFRAIDDQTLRELSERYAYLQNLEERRSEIIKSIEEQGKMTEELLLSIESARILAELEDLYRPYRQKRRTRATFAREKGLEPLADIIFAQEDGSADPLALAAGYVDAEKGVRLRKTRLMRDGYNCGAISDDASIRKALRSTSQLAD